MNHERLHEEVRLLKGHGLGQECVSNLLSSTIYAHSTEAQKQSAGVYEDSIRVSVGIEDIKDLIEDFEQAINKMNASSYNS